MNSSNLERAAYLAAHRIMQADLTNPQFACPGTRRSKMVDAIAGIIKDVMEAEAISPEDELAQLHRFYAESIEARTR